MRRLLLVFVLAALLAGGWFYASPWLAMRHLSQAAAAGDGAALEQAIDFPALRASASEQVSEATRRRIGQGGLVDQIGGAVAERLGREAAERALTPDSIGNVVRIGSVAAPFVPQRLRGQSLDWAIEREGFDHFRARGRFEDGTPGPVLIFRREGLGWVMTGFELPDLG